MPKHVTVCALDVNCMTKRVCRVRQEKKRVCSSRLQQILTFGVVCVCVVKFLHTRVFVFYTRDIKLLLKAKLLHTPTPNPQSTRGALIEHPEGNP